MSSGIAVRQESPNISPTLLHEPFLKSELTEVIQVMEATQKIGEVDDPAEANGIFGVPTITVQQWCQRQKEALAL